MNEFEYEQKQIHVDVDAVYSDLRSRFKKNKYKKNEIALIDKAFTTAREFHGEQLRRSGEPYIIHPLAVAEIILNLGMDYQSIVAALLHDTVEDTSYTIEELTDDFGEDVAVIVDGVTKLGQLQFTDYRSIEEQQAENIRKMFLAMSKDIRVIIVKLADRLHNMRTLEFVSPQKQRDKALETLEIYAPIAHRLGIRSIKDELEDRSIRFLDPVAYANIEEKLKNFSKEGNEFLQNTQNHIIERVRKVCPSATISGRIKSVHGIYRKMYMQSKQFDEIYDIYAVRIIVDNLIDCYNCLGVIHDMYRPLPGRFKDYISTPKPNGYQSLHTTVVGRDAIPFEVQIRSVDMHKTAEFGIAAHWKYKLGVTSNNAAFDSGLKWIREMLEAQQQGEGEIISSIKTDLIPEEVFVLTPKGDVINVPQGSTVIDFAYAIHSAVGHKMTGAKVDGKIVPLDYVMKNGEICEILTSQQQGKGPSRDWLNIAKTSKAKNRIRSWFKNERRDENIVEGKAEIEREFKRNYIHLTEEEYDEFIDRLVKQQHMDSTDDFYAAIGYGGLVLSKIMPNIKEYYHKHYGKSAEEESDIIKTSEEKIHRKSSTGVIINGMDNVLVKFSKCCNPLPGDEIIGFITRGHGVSIHKRDCENVPRDIEHCNEPGRWIEARWSEVIKETYKATIVITCLSRIGLFAEISSQVSQMNVNITSVNSRDLKDGRNVLELTVQVTGLEHLKKLAEKISHINGVISVER